MTDIKVLGLRTPQRYAIKRTLIAAQEALRRQLPDLEVVIGEITKHSEIRDYTPVTILSSLVVNAKLVCVGHLPKKDESTA